MASFITFLTDFGLQDDFVGTCHGVMKRIAPEVEIIDITHGIAPQAVLQGALTLANTLPFMPEGVHLAVVDPGVGGARRALALRDAQGRMYVGPDNGLLIPAAEKLGGIMRVHVIDNIQYRLPVLTSTFHGRDLFAPVAAHLSLGARLEEAGESIDPVSLVKLDLPTPRIGSDEVVAHAIHVDGYGNVTLDLDAPMLAGGPLSPGDAIEIRAPDGRFEGVWARTFADVDGGDVLLFEDSSGALALAVSGGSAAGLMNVTPDREITLRTLK